MPLPVGYVKGHAYTQVRMPVPAYRCASMRVWREVQPTTKGASMNWWSLYGLALSGVYIGIFIMLTRSHRLMRKHVRATHQACTVLALAASNMWDALTPEQIRTLHPNTVEVGNGVPPWSANGAKAFDGVSFTLHVVRAHNEPNQTER